jgi:hypothetical protein
MKIAVKWLNLMFRTRPTVYVRLETYFALTFERFKGIDMGTHGGSGSLSCDEYKGWMIKVSKKKRREGVVLNCVGRGQMESTGSTGLQYWLQAIISALLSGFIWNPPIIAHQGEELSSDRLSFCYRFYIR